MEGLVDSPNGFYKPGEDGCSHPLLAVLVFWTQAAMEAEIVNIPNISIGWCIFEVSIENDFEQPPEQDNQGLYRID